MRWLEEAGGSEERSGVSLDLIGWRKLFDSQSQIDKSKTDDSSELGHNIWSLYHIDVISSPETRRGPQNSSVVREEKRSMN